MASEPIRTTDYEQYMAARERQVRAEIIAENEELRELCHRLTFELENLKVKYESSLDITLAMNEANSIMADDLSRSDAIRWSLQERYVNLAADILAIPVKD